MSRFGCSLTACICIITGLLFLLHSLFASRWISACVSLASAVLDPDGQPPSFPELFSKAESVKFSPLGTGSLLMNQQLLKEKGWLFENLKSKRVCMSKGFFDYCLVGEGVMRFGNYRVCIDNGEDWNLRSSTEWITVSALALSVCGSIISIVLLLTAFRVEFCRGNVKAVNVLRYMSAIIIFISGTLVLLGLLPTAAQAISYSANPTNFYNDMVSRIGSGYLFDIKVNWAFKDGDLTAAQMWARTVVQSISDLGLDRDFFIALAAGICLYSACASLILRSNSEQTEKHPNSLFSNQKQS